MSKTSNNYKAVSLLEIVVAVALLSVILTIGFSLLRSSVWVAERAEQYTTAEILASELVDLVISKRNENWNSLEEGQFYLAEDEEEGFVFTAGTETVDEFTRWVEISAVERNSQGDIVASGGSVDRATWLLEAYVVWNIRENEQEVVLRQYLTNWNRF